MFKQIVEEGIIVEHQQRHTMDGRLEKKDEPLFFFSFKIFFFCPAAAFLLFSFRDGKEGEESTRIIL